LKIALAGCLVLPEPNPDASLEQEAFRAAGHECEWVAWDDPSVDPEQYDAVVVRATWNYVTDPHGFLAWAQRVASDSVLVNPVDTVSWNIDKVYLQELADKSVPVVPTQFYSRDTGPNLLADLAKLGWEDVVVKPSVSAASFLTRRFRAGEHERAEEFLVHMLAKRDAMVQPYIEGVDRLGEHSLAFFDGEASHVVRKQARFDGGDESVSEAMEPTEFERDVLQLVLDALPVPHAYGRLDLVPDSEGNPLVSEVELIEPSLFFAQRPEALEAFVRATTDFVASQASSLTPA
jgi:hypothetical protein